MENETPSLDLVGLLLGQRYITLLPSERQIRRGFYMYTITKDGPDVHTTKKFGDTSISSRFSF